MRSTPAIMTHETNTGNVITKEPTQSGPACPLCGNHEVSDLLRAPDRFHGRRELYRLASCSSCGSVWLASPPPPEEMGFHYGEEYHQAIMAAGEGSPFKRWRRQRERILRQKQSGAILDLGCSSGGFLKTMKGESWKLFGIEMEASTAEKARQATGAEVFVGDIVDAPFPAESFDVITCFDVLEHIYDPHQFLGKVWKWLKPGGIYFAMLPNIDCWEMRILGTYWYGLELPRHLFHFSPRSLRYIMKPFGFQEVELATPRISYLERSAGYVGSAILEKMGFSPEPQSRPRQPGIPERALRKAMRLTLVASFAQLASIAGSGPTIEAIFRKPV
jgi:SAM-dependent methyltransferase